MTTTQWALVLSIAVACIAVGNYFGGERADSTAKNSASAAMATEPVLHPAQAESAIANDAGDSGAAASEVTAADLLTRLTADVTADDADTRAAAINTLATLPTAQAIAVLQKIINSGGDEDRLLTINALHSLAVSRGDAGGEIRDILRLAIYDGGDEGVVENAQAALDDIDHRAERLAAQHGTVQQQEER